MDRAQRERPDERPAADGPDAESLYYNPYHRDDLLLPELAASYLDRDADRPGMIAADDPVVEAFAAIGWSWGGDWTSLKDYQHFSARGR